MNPPGPSIARRILLLPPIRLVLSLLLVSALSALPFLAAHFAHAGRPSNFVRESFSAAAAVVALLVLARFYERRTLDEVGLQTRHGARDLFAGFLIGASLLALSVGTLAALGWYHFQGFNPAPAGHTWAGTLCKLLLFFALVAVTEEVLFRAIVFRILEEAVGTWGALAVSAAFFGFAHANNPGASTTSSVAIMLEAGLMLGAAFVLTRGLALVVGIHWAWNFFEGPVFGTQVSGEVLPFWIRSTMTGPVTWTGGAFGPEGGGVVMLYGTSLGALFLVLAFRRGQLRRRVRRTAPPVLPDPA